MFGSGGKRVTDAAGRFEVDDAPVGRDLVTLFPQDFSTSAYGFGRIVAVVEGGKVNELPDLRLVKRRVKGRDRGGDLGFSTKEELPDEDPEARRWVVAVVRAGGPAARAGLVIGDVIVSVEGHDVRGANGYLYGSLTRVPEGTSVALGLERGAKVAITAAKPL
jgi:S1-C subfamily serine protease